MIKAVIYDLDELMVDSNELHHLATEKVLAKYGKSVREVPPKVLSSYMGMRVKDILKSVVSILKIDTDAEQFITERNKVFLELVKTKLTLMPGLIHSLEYCRKNGYKTAIASSGTREYIEIVVDKFAIRSYFNLIITGDDVQIGKPNLEVYQTTCKKLGFSPQECVVLEDATNGVTAAKGAGCNCIGIRDPHSPQQDLSKADLIIQDLSKLEEGIKILST